MDAQSQIGALSHSGMALLLVTLLTAAQDTRPSVPPTSIYAAAPPDPLPRAGAEPRKDAQRAVPRR